MTVNIVTGSDNDPRHVIMERPDPVRAVKWGDPLPVAQDMVQSVAAPQQLQELNQLEQDSQDVQPEMPPNSMAVPLAPTINTWEQQNNDPRIQPVPQNNPNYLPERQLAGQQPDMGRVFSSPFQQEPAPLQSAYGITARDMFREQAFAAQRFQQQQTPTPAVPNSTAPTGDPRLPQSARSIFNGQFGGATGNSSNRGAWNWDSLGQEIGQTWDVIRNFVTDVTRTVLPGSYSERREQRDAGQSAVAAAYPGTAEALPAFARSFLAPETGNPAQPRAVDLGRGYFGEMGTGLRGAALYGLSMPGQLTSASIYSIVDLGRYLVGGEDNLPGETDDYRHQGFRYAQALSGTDLGFTNVRNANDNRYLSAIDENAPLWVQIPQGVLGFIGDTIGLGWADDALIGVAGVARRALPTNVPDFSFRRGLTTVGETTERRTAEALATQAAVKAPTTGVTPETSGTTSASLEPVSGAQGGTTTPSYEVVTIPPQSGQQFVPFTEFAASVNPAFPMPERLYRDNETLTQIARNEGIVEFDAPTMTDRELIAAQSVAPESTLNRYGGLNVEEVVPPAPAPAPSSNSDTLNAFLGEPVPSIRNPVPPTPIPVPANIPDERALLSSVPPTERTAPLTHSTFYDHQNTGTTPKYYQVDTNTIETSEFSPAQLQQAVEAIRANGGQPTERVLLNRTGVESYQVVQGELQVAAMRQLHDTEGVAFEMTDAFVLPSQARQAERTGLVRPPTELTLAEKQSMSRAEILKFGLNNTVPQRILDARAATPEQWIENAAPRSIENAQPGVVSAMLDTQDALIVSGRAEGQLSTEMVQLQEQLRSHMDELGNLPNIGRNYIGDEQGVAQLYRRAEQLPTTNDLNHPLLRQQSRGVYNFFESPRVNGVLDATPEPNTFEVSFSVDGNTLKQADSTPPYADMKAFINRFNQLANSPASDGMRFTAHANAATPEEFLMKARFYTQNGFSAHEIINGVDGSRIRDKVTTLEAIQQGLKDKPELYTINGGQIDFEFRRDANATRALSNAQTYWHGSKQQDIQRIAPNLGSSSNELGSGLYLTSNAREAELYAKAGSNRTQLPLPTTKRSEQGFVYELQASISKPLDADVVPPKTVETLFNNSVTSVYGEEFAKRYVASVKGTPLNRRWLAVRDLWGQTFPTRPLSELKYQQFQRQVAEGLQRRGYDGIQQPSRGITVLLDPGTGQLPLNVTQRTQVGVGTPLESARARRLIDQQLHAYYQTPTTEVLALQGRVGLETQSLDELVKSYEDSLRRGETTVDNYLAAEKLVQQQSKRVRDEALQMATRDVQDDVTKQADNINIGGDSPCS